MKGGIIWNGTRARAVVVPAASPVRAVMALEKNGLAGAKLQLAMNVAVPEKLPAQHVTDQVKPTK